MYILTPDKVLGHELYETDIYRNENMNFMNQKNYLYEILSFHCSENLDCGLLDYDAV